jgi:hypothetical protein
MGPFFGKLDVPVWKQLVAEEGGGDIYREIYHASYTYSLLCFNSSLDNFLFLIRIS